MVSNTSYPALHILGSQNVYSRAKGIAPLLALGRFFPFQRPTTSINFNLRALALTDIFIIITTEISTSIPAFYLKKNLMDLSMTVWRVMHPPIGIVGR